MRLDVLLEDDWVLAIHKPSGLAVQPGGGLREATLLDWIAGHLGPRALRNGFRASPAHRLDRETSGVVLIAKRRPAMVRLAAAFERREVRKRYVALVSGSPSADSGVIERALRDLESATPERITELGPPRPARTKWTVRERFSGVTLLDLEPETGRRHQLRRHLAALGLPIVGDRIHRGGKVEAFSAGRLLLHAAALCFPHPRDGSLTRVEAPLPAEFLAEMELIRRRP
jgi:23S rRNA pseudouridine955/2504/2580 synthase